MSIEVYQTDAGSFELRVDADHDTVWASQKQIAGLFDVDKTNITHHIQNIYAEGELDAASTSEETSLVQMEGGREVSRRVTLYNLDMILAIGYRVSGRRATAFRRWATGVLRSYVERGFTVNEERLAEDPEARRQLAATIRALRLSEAEMYQKVRDVFKASASDYDSNSQSARSFFAMAQDKFHYAVTQKTAAQLVLERASASKPNLGMRDEVAVTRANSEVAKNYLDEDELHALENISEQFLLFAESKAFRGQKMTMEELAFKLNTLLTANDYPVLYEYGSYQRGEANDHVKREIARYRDQQPQITGPAD